MTETMLVNLTFSERPPIPVGVRLFVITDPPVVRLRNEGRGKPDPRNQKEDMNDRLTQELEKIIGGDGEVLHTYHDLEAGYWTAYFSTEVAALRVYHRYGGSETFGNRRVQEVQGGQFEGAFMLTSHTGKGSEFDAHRQRMIDATANLFTENDQGMIRFVLGKVPTDRLPIFIKKLLDSIEQNPTEKSV